MDLPALPLGIIQHELKKSYIEICRINGKPIYMGNSDETIPTIKESVETGNRNVQELIKNLCQQKKELLESLSNICERLIKEIE